jgi:hypothetical protein
MAFRGPRSLLGLLASWIGWWVVLAAWKLGPAIPAILRVSQEGAKGNANIQFGDGAFSATITEGATVAWEGHISFLTLVLLVGVPPLILWALWLRGKNRAGDPALVGEGSAQRVDVPRDERVTRKQP